MDPVVTIDNPNVSVEPGGQATVRVKVRNRSSIVEGFELDVVGEPSGWAQLYPPELEVRPQQEAETVVIFSPPAGAATHAGQVPFGVRAVSRVDTEASAVAEGDLTVGSVAQSQAKITPVTSKGRFSGKHRIEMANWGNSPARLALEVSDPDAALGFLLTPDVLDLPIGTTGRAKLKLRARKPFFRGAPQRRAFRVVGRPIEPGAYAPAEGPTPQFGYDPTTPSVDGAFEQRPILGGAVIPLAVTALIAAGLIGWLSTRGNDDSSEGTRRPQAPQALQAARIASDSVELRWPPLQRGNIEGYKVASFDPAERDADSPTPLEVVAEDVDADSSSFTVGDLEPATPYCFGVASVRGGIDSRYTDLLCTETSALGAPPSPSEVSVAPAPDGKARVTWVDGSNGTADHVVLRDGVVVGNVAKPLAEAIVDVGGDNCYQVQSATAEVRSAPVPQPCVTLAGTGGGAPGPAGGAAGGAGPGPAGGGVGGPVVAGGGGGSGGGGSGENGGAPAAGWIAIVGSIPIDDVDAELRATQRVDLLRAQGHAGAAFILSTDYPNLGLTAGKYLIYVPGFPSEAEANAFCTAGGYVGCLIRDLSADTDTDASSSTTTTEP